jgi:hypothetical protein
MIYRLIDLPESVLGFKVSWSLRRNDFEEVAIPCVQSEIKKRGQANIILLVSDLIREKSLEWLNEALNQLRHLSGSRRVAIVADESSHPALSSLDHHEFHLFSSDQLNSALEWVAEAEPA